MRSVYKQCLKKLLITVALVGWHCPGLFAFDTVFPEAGAWNNVEGRGRGYGIEIQDGQVFVLIYAYNEMGDPTWLLAFGDYEPLDPEVDGLIGQMKTTLYEASDGQCIGCPPTIHTEQPSPHGDFTISFSSNQEAFIEIGEVEVTEIKRFGWSWKSLAEKLTGYWALTNSDGTSQLIRISSADDSADVFELESGDGEHLGTLSLDETGTPIMDMETLTGSPFEIYAPELNRFIGRSAIAVDDDSGNIPHVIAARLDEAFQNTIPGFQTSQTSKVSSPNILIIVADDQGQDSASQYRLSSDPPLMPNLDELAQSGLTFDQVWVTPLCATTRAALLTGRYNFQNGVERGGHRLSETETTLFEMIEQLDDSQTIPDYQTAAIGKWHLGGNDASHPQASGVDYFAGNLRGFTPDLESPYTNWPLHINGVQTDLAGNPSDENVNEYNTTALTDLAINWINTRDDPWVMWLSYNAAHDPFHIPPENLLSIATNASMQNSPDTREMYLAALEAMDTEIGRLIGNLPSGLEDTIVIYLGDNGSPAQARDGSVYSQGHTKASIYQGGIRVPFFVAGANVGRKGEREDALIDPTDLFITVAELIGATTEQAGTNGQSFAGLLNDAEAAKRPYAFSELYADTSTAWAVRNEQYKLIDFDGITQELYDVNYDPDEQNNLLTSASNFEQVRQELESVAFNVLNN